MKLSIAVASLVLCMGLSTRVEAGPHHFFEHVDEFMKTYVVDGSVDYEAILASPSGLNGLLSLVRYGPYNPKKIGSLDPKIHKAFWVNAYNILVIKTVVDNYPLKNPLDLPGFFDKNLHTVAGEKLTLNDIENKKLRAVYDDPRIHFVLVCAAQSCPVLRKGAYFPEELDKQLTEQTKIAMDDPDFIRVDGVKMKVEVSQIFKWYRSDFKTSGDIRGFINQYKNRQLPFDYNLSYYTYDWRLNDTPKKQ